MKKITLVVLYTVFFILNIYSQNCGYCDSLSESLYAETSSSKFYIADDNLYKWPYDSVIMPLIGSKLNPNLIIKDLLVFGEFKWSFLTLSDSLFFVEIQSLTSMAQDTTFTHDFGNLKGLIISGVENPKHDIFPDFIKYCDEMEYLAFCINNKEMEKMPLIPQSVKCLIIFNYSKTKEISKSVFDLPNLRSFSNYSRKKIKPLVMPDIWPESTKIQRMELAIDLGDPKNIEILKRFKNLKCLIVSDYKSNDYSLLKELDFIEKISITLIGKKNKKRFKQLKKLSSYSVPENVKWPKVRDKKNLVVF